MDVELIDAEGNALDIVSPFERRDVKCFSFDTPGLSDVARENRAILAGALVGAGITNYPSEFWHYSYGDQGWAYRGGEPAALYGAITPDGWTPDPKDDIEAPLGFY